MNLELENLLKNCNYFKGLSAEGRKALEAVCLLEEFGKRDYLFHEGQKGRAVFLLASGGVQLIKTSEDGREVVIRTVAPGELFAEVILFEQSAYPVTAAAVADSRVYAVPKAEFHDLLNDREFRAEFIGSLMGRMRYLADRILSLTVHDVEERFVQFLKEQYGRGKQYEVTMSKKDMAAAIGATPETFSRLIQKLKSDGKMTWDAGVITVTDEFWQQGK